MNENSWKEAVSGCEQKFLKGVSMSAETDGPIGILVPWRDWNFVSSEANYFILV